MAVLGKHDDRESWIKWAREFVRRGFRPPDFITVHGPHSPPGDCHWGEAECTRDGNSDNVIEVSFSSRRPCHKYVVRNVVMWEHDEYGDAAYEPDIRFPLLKPSELSPRARRWLRVAERVLNGLVEERRRSYEKMKEIRRKINEDRERGKR